jgi:positive phototaxis protein PixI
LNLVNENQAHLTPKIGVNNPGLRQFLRFQLQPNFTAVVEIDQRGGTLCAGAASTLAIRVTELINMPIDLVLPIPHLPPAVMGVYNWRGEILWVVDLGILLGLTDHLTTHHRNLQPTIAISSAATTGSEAKTIGLVVDEISDIEWYQPELIVEPIADSSNPELYRWIKGYVISAVGEKLAILDGQAIIERTDLHAEI